MVIRNLSSPPGHFPVGGAVQNEHKVLARLELRRRLTTTTCLMLNRDRHNWRHVRIMWGVHLVHTDVGHVI